MADLVTFGETPLRFSPPKNERVEMARKTYVYADGIESNTAVAAAERGTDALWISKQPDTAVGRNAVRKIESTGVDTAVTWTEDPELRQGILFREEGVHPRESEYWHDRRNTAAGSTKPGEVPIETVREAEIVYTALSTAVLSDQATKTSEALLSASGSAGSITTIDVDYDPGIADAKRYRDVFEQLTGAIDMLIVTETAVRDVLEETGRPRELTNTLSSIYDLQIVIIRQSDGRTVALHDTPGTNVIHEREPIETDVVDPTGERGAFAGVFLHELIEGSDTASALSHGVAGAALTETTPGPFLNCSESELDRVVEMVEEKST